ncbi:MAG TPA: hypothetical protein VJ183_18180 [Chloroflexia bacterium]|nr:hypothetical protein [Chloroflexia bacterium]
MRTYRRWMTVLPVVALLLMSGVLARGAAAAQAKSAKEVVLAWLDALNAHDEGRLRELSHPEMTLESDPNEPDHSVVTYDMFFATLHEDVESELHWEVLSAEETAVDMVHVEASLTSHDIPVLEHGFVVIVDFTVKDGQLFHAVDRLSEQTKAELAALSGPVGMPTTGAGDSGLLAALLALGALSLVVGTGVRRKAARAA